MPGPTYPAALANSQEFAWSPPLVGDSVVYAGNNTYAALAKYFGQETENEILAAQAMSVADKSWQFQYTCLAGLAVGSPVYLSANDTVTLADSTTGVKNQCIGFVRFKGTLGSASNPSATTCYLQQFLVVTGLSGGTAGNDCYLTDAGSFSATPGTVITPLGIFIDTTTAIVYAGPRPNRLLNAYLASNGTNATATLATTGLSVSLAAGLRYKFTGILYVANSQAAEGAQIDLNGGSATMTDLRAEVEIIDTALQKAQQVSALATAVSAATVTGDALIRIAGSCKVNAAGTFIPRYAEASHTSGTLTIYKGSTLEFVPLG